MASGKIFLRHKKTTCLYSLISNTVLESDVLGECFVVLFTVCPSPMIHDLAVEDKTQHEPSDNRVDLCDLIPPLYVLRYVSISFDTRSDSMFIDCVCLRF
ncbi:hypothetical protein RF11_09266 [Thelohanellus kitauei]|uniref:Uncharacterized protein n=1 Tax=Thelohanellus kitauei TaxID=669202 RepID=A0A0C2MCJ9_THEKT|nr:hypothetical protein RF11_09266 [Thelohanellus kitauei]